MALPKLFQRIFFHNNTTPAINEDNLNAMSKAIDDIDDRVIELGSDVMEKVPLILQKYADIETLSENPPYIGANGNWYVWDTSTDPAGYTDSGIDASITVNIADITMLEPTAAPYVTNTGTNTDPIFHLFIPRGKGISSIAKTSTSGLVDTYTITYSDGLTTTFTVTNGKTAYQSAVEGGYTGTEADFEDDLAHFGEWANTASAGAQTATTKAGEASASATTASNSATTATNKALDAEAYGAGTRNGVDVPSTDPAYHNNAKYYSEQAAGQTLAGLSDVDVNAQTLANGDVPVYNSTTQKWENGQVSVADKMDKANPTGTGSFSLNRKANTTVENYSFAEGSNTTASGIASHAEGAYTVASGTASHAEGGDTIASSNYSHAEGIYTEATTNFGSHAEGCGYDSTYKVIASGKGAHAEGVASSSKSVTASGEGSHAEGYTTTASGNYGSHAEGRNTTANASSSHAEGSGTTASGAYSHAEGSTSTASGTSSHAEGSSTATGLQAHSENNARAEGDYSHAGGKGYCRSYRNVSFVHGNIDSNSYKFRGANFTDNYGTHVFGFDVSGEVWTTDTTPNFLQTWYGIEGAILNTATVTLELNLQGQYILICSSYTISSGAIYGATARLIIASGISTGTPTNVSLGQTSNAPATIAMAANNKITIKNGATSRATQFSLIRIN